MRTGIFVCYLMFISILGFSQSRKAQSLITKAEAAFKQKSYDTAQDLFLKAYELDGNSAEVLFKLGKIEALQRNETSAVTYFKKTLAIDSLNPAFTDAHTFLGFRELKVGNYREAKAYLIFTLKNTPASAMLYHDVREKIEQCEHGIKAMENALIINPIKLPEQINRKAKQYFPVFTADNQTLFFTAVEENGDENIYSAKFTEGNFSTPELVNGGINSDNNEGTCSISSDGRTMVFTSCEGRSTYGSCDLYITYKKGEQWAEPQNLGASVNTPFWESQPALSSDGKLLFFASERPGGMGRKDLWLTQLNKDNEWSIARNLGSTINTPADDISPFIHANGTTIFYASNGRQSFGGFDLFMANIKDGNFEEPQNLGYPINNAADQVSLFVTSDGKSAYYATDNKKRIDLYSFEIPDELKTKYKKVNFLKGVVSDKNSGKPSEAAIQLIDLKSQQILSSINSDPITGEYVLVLPQGSRYGIFVSKENYLFKSLNFDVSETENAEGKVLNVALEPIEKQANIVLSNIFFDSGSAALREDSYFELDKLVKLLTENPTIQAKIKGHTDDVGNETDNLQLSQARAEAVVAYLVAKRIPEGRIVPIGFGESMPLFPNESEASRQLNRRIEFSIQ